MHNIKNISVMSERIRLILACEFDTRMELRETRDEARRLKALHAKHSARQARQARKEYTR